MTGGNDRGAVEEQVAPTHDDEWLQGVVDALRMAAKDAHLKAYQTGTGVAYQRNGKFGVYAPDPEMYEDLIPAPFVEQSES